MTKLASSIAGSRLLAIMLVLLLPMGFLGYLTVHRLTQDIDFTEKQLKGLTIVQEGMPLLLGTATRSLEKEKVKAAVDIMLSNAAEIGATDEASAFISRLVGNQHSVASKLTIMSDSLYKIGAKSNLLLDPSAETYHLALAATSNLPEMAVKLHDVALALDGSVLTFVADANQKRKLVWSLGRLQESSDQAAATIFQAMNVSNESAQYNTASRQIGEIRNVVNELSLALIGEDITKARDVTSALLNERTKVQTRFDTIMSIHRGATDTLGVALKQRLGAMHTQLRNLLAVVLGCVVLALGGSFLLFRNTLKRLDQVETERMRAEAMGERINVVNEDLSRVNSDLADKMARLKSAQDELINSRRMEQLGQLTATIAHEIRNPLGSVRTSAFLLEKKLANKNMGVEQQIDRINKGVVRCDNIITQLLDYSRTKAVQTKSMKLDDWLVGIVTEEAQRLSHNVALECELGLDEIEVPFDPARLQRAVINLINNACEAMLTDRNLSAEKSPLIRITTALSEGGFAISVADNGPGISPENLAKVREPLFTTKSFGTGLGIPAIEQIAQQHGGRLDIASEPGQGATFSIWLPATSIQLDTATAA